MGDYKKYYDNTENQGPAYNVRKFIDLKVEPAEAIELGCGAGRDTVYLIKNGWHVTAIDINDTEERIRNKLDKQEQDLLKFEQKDFEDIELNKCKLIVANNCLSFCNPQNFAKMWKEIVDCLENGGYFVGNFFGIHDEWNGKRANMTFFSENQVNELFKDFETIEFREFDKDGKTGDGNDKHWHIFWVSGKRRN